MSFLLLTHQELKSDWPQLRWEIGLYTKDKDEKKYTKVSKESIDLELQPIEETQTSRPASPMISQSNRGRGYDKGRGAARSGPSRIGKRQRTATTEYDFSQFNAD